MNAAATSPLRDETPADLQRRIARSREILAGIEAKIQRLLYAKEQRRRALEELNAATSRGLDHELRS
jgi:hypothetical protein